MDALTFKEVYDYILDNKLYRDPALSPSRLAHKLNVSSSALKQMCKDYCGNDFKCFITELRVKEAKRMIEESCYSGFSIDAIGRMAGFNSKTEFVSNFKEMVGRLPSDYKASYKYVF